MFNPETLSDFQLILLGFKLDVLSAKVKKEKLKRREIRRNKKLEKRNKNV